ncbi:MAG: Vms1/Ankzf1 family peptidyl-tRNA hydrolase [Actinomycetota bacterium]
MTELDRALIRKLAEWTPGDLPVTSVYLSVDGRLYPRKKDYELRLDELLRKVREEAGAKDVKDKEVARSVEGDAEAARAFVLDRFDRGTTRGLAMFSCSAAGLWEEIELSRPVRNSATIGPHPDLLQLESVLETYESFCTVLVDSEKARIFLAELGRIEEESDLIDDVPNRHDQGGWSQGRFQRHVDEHRKSHLKHTAEVLFRFWKRRQFDHLILGGPEEIVAEFERELHDYLTQRILARVGLPIGASQDELLARSLEAEEDLERRRVREAIDRILAEEAAGRQAVGGLGATLAALADNRVATLVVRMDLHAPGRECPSCERLAESGKRCKTCGSETREVADVVEAAVAQALRRGARVETVLEDGGFEALGGLGALLRF